jgi:CubicO group peptidase (beta-lactamase class C family)
MTATTGKAASAWPSRHRLFATARIGALLAAGAVAPILPVVDPVPRAAVAAPAPGCTEVTPAAAEEFFNAAVPGQLARDKVPGTVVSVVTGGQTVFAKGYGFADLENQVRFDASESLVRIASITKLFTWTAVMQQVEAGRLDLNADVNRYLTAFKIPDTYPKPVTLRDLMSHTAGFEDRIIGTGARSADDVEPLEDYLAQTIPARIRPPGEVSAYSNYGAALAGYIVARVSGEPYDRYVQTHLFDPLGMTRSTAAEPVPAALAADLARSYDSDATPPQLVPFQFDRLGPDGSISSTAEDMAKFMTAHLRQGRAATGSILQPATTAQMHQRSFSADPRLTGYAHGFKERLINGHRVLMHDGSWEGFLSGLILVPDCDLGLFLSTNGTSGTETVTALTDDFFNRFTPPVTPTAVADGPAPTEPATAKAGFYAPTRHNESSVERVLTLVTPRLTVAGDGTVRFRGKEWKPLGDGLYQEADGSERLSFRSGTGGQVYVVTDGPTYQLLGPADSLMVNLGLILIFLVIALTALAVPVAGLRRRFTRRTGTIRPRMWRWARALAAGAALVGLAVLVLVVLTLLGDTGDYLYGAPLSFRLLLTLPLLVLAAAAASTVLTVAGWRRSGAGIVVRIHQVAVLVGLATLAWLLIHWNLVGWWSA